MYKYFGFFLILATSVVLLTNCKKDDDDDNNPVPNEEQAAIDEQIIKDYLDANNLAATRDSSGVYYIIKSVGGGDHPTSQSLVEVLYQGKLIDGTIFDETTQGSVTFLLTDLIEGWQIGIPYLKEGGSGTFFIPSGLGYGTSSSGSVPANSVLIFDVDLIKVWS